MYISHAYNNNTDLNLKLVFCIHFIQIQMSLHLSRLELHVDKFDINKKGFYLVYSKIEEYNEIFCEHHGKAPIFYRVWRFEQCKRRESVYFN